MLSVERWFTVVVVVVVITVVVVVVVVVVVELEVVIVVSGFINNNCLFTFFVFEKYGDYLAACLVSSVSTSSANIFARRACHK